jgi:hypothetical protein
MLLLLCPTFTSCSASAPPTQARSLPRPHSSHAPASKTQVSLALAVAEHGIISRALLQQEGSTLFALVQYVHPTQPDSSLVCRQQGTQCSWLGCKTEENLLCCPSQAALIHPSYFPLPRAPPHPPLHAVNTVRTMSGKLGGGEGKLTPQQGPSRGSGHTPAAAVTPGGVTPGTWPVSAAGSGRCSGWQTTLAGMQMSRGAGTYKKDSTGAEVRNACTNHTRWHHPVYAEPSVHDH